MQSHSLIQTLSSRSLPWLAAAVMGASALTGCVVAPVGPAYGNGGYYDNEYVAANVAPPAPYVETIPVAPFIGALWIGGFWDWSGGRHVWRPGHYERPRAGYSYRQPAWNHGPDGRWMLNRGGWDNGHGGGRGDWRR